MSTMQISTQKSNNKKVILSDVIDEQLSKVVSSFKRDGAEKVEVDPQKNGLYKVIAHFVSSNL